MDVQLGVKKDKTIQFKKDFSEFLGILNNVKKKK